jgi:predicted oxidoreductase
MSENLVSATQRQLGATVEVGPIAFGCWRFTGASDADNARLVAGALDLGINLVDNADVYGLDWGGAGFGACEEALGRVFRLDPSLRDRIALATKGGIIPGVPYNSSAKYLIEACEHSLRRMSVEHVELYQVHRPDVFTHPDEVATAFSSLHDRGLVLMFGVSNYTPAQTRSLLARAHVPLVSTQPEFSCAELTAMRDGTLDLCIETGITPLAWSPLAGGRVISGEGLNAALIAVLDEIAEREKVSRAAVAVAFVLAHPADVVAIVGTQDLQHLAEITMATSVHLTRADAYRIVEASDGVKLP